MKSINCFICGVAVLLSGFIQAGSPNWPVVYKNVSLKTGNQYYFVAEGNGGNTVNADRVAQGPWETFELYDLNGGQLFDGDEVNLKTSSNYYFIADQGGGGQLDATATVASTWETFNVIAPLNPGVMIAPGSWVALESDNGHYVQAHFNGGSSANAQATAIGCNGQSPCSWEAFQIQLTGPFPQTAQVGLISNTDINDNILCMGVDNPGSNAIVTAVTCDNSAPLWSVRTDGRIGYGPDGDNSTLCLDADLGHPYNANKLMLWDCSGLASNQSWTWQQTGLVSLNANGLCIANNGLGAQLSLAGCNASTQSWDLTKTSGKIELTPAGSGKCLGLMASPNAGSGVTTVDCNSAPIWQVNSPASLLNGGSTKLAFEPASYDLCLDVDTGHPYNWNKGSTWFCYGLDVNQQWRWQPDGLMVLQSKGLCLTPPSHPAQLGQQLIIAGCNAGTQAWAFK